LRVSVTDRCDSRCRYCVPCDSVRLAPSRSTPSLEELPRFLGWLTPLGQGSRGAGAGAALDRRPADVTAELRRYLVGKTVPRVMEIPHAMSTLGG